MYEGAEGFTVSSLLHITPPSHTYDCCSWSPVSNGGPPPDPQADVCASTLVTPTSVCIAVKAGGMRIVQKHPHTGDGKEEKDKDDQEWESTR